MSRTALPRLVDDWVLDKRVRSRRGLSANSEIAYRRDLSGFAKRVANADRRPLPELDPSDPFAASNRQLERITLKDFTDERLRRVISEMVVESKSAATRARFLAALRGFCEWLVVNKHLNADPTLGFESPAADKLLPVALKAAELERIAAAIVDPPENQRVMWPARDLAMFGVLAGCGVRASELLGIRVADFNTDGSPTLTVLGKGAKQRTIPVASEVLEAVTNYTDARTEAEGKLSPSAPIFVRKNLKLFNVPALDLVVDWWLRAAGVAAPPQEKAHLMRHTFAVNQLNSGTTIAELSSLLGHESIATTSKYLRVAADGLHHTARSTGPVNSLLSKYAQPALARS